MLQLASPETSIIVEGFLFVFHAAVNTRVRLLSLSIVALYFHPPCQGHNGYFFSRDLDDL